MKTPAPETTAGRKKLAAKGQALPDGTDPIPDLGYLRRAIKSIGRVTPSKRPAVKALIRKRAKELGAASAEGVKGTWAFQAANTSGGAIDLAMPSKPPMVRGAADISVTRTGPGALSVTHRSTGAKVGALASSGDGKTGWVATHASGKKFPPAPSVSGALAGLIAYHNKMASGDSDDAVAATAEPQDPVDLATPAASASDGPRVTTMGGGKKPANAPELPPGVAAIFAKLVKKGFSPKSALAFAKRGAAMHAKKTPAAKAA
jgi:hypothetical protein